MRLLPSALLAASLIMGVPAFACPFPVIGQSPQAALEASDYVFLGRILNRETGWESEDGDNLYNVTQKPLSVWSYADHERTQKTWQDHKVDFEIVHSFKGDLFKHIFLFTDTRGGDYDEQAIYLLFLDTNKKMLFCGPEKENSFTNEAAAVAHVTRLLRTPDEQP